MYKFTRTRAKDRLDRVFRETGSTTTNRRANEIFGGIRYTQLDKTRYTTWTISFPSIKWFD